MELGCFYRSGLVSEVCDGWIATDSSVMKRDRTPGDTYSCLWERINQHPVMNTCRMRWWPAALTFINVRLNVPDFGVEQEPLGTFLKIQFKREFYKEVPLGKKYSTGCVFVESKGSGIFREHGKYGFYLYMMSGGRGDRLPRGSWER